MRWLKKLWPLGLCMAAVLAQGQADSAAALMQGRLVMWVVRPAAKGWSPENAALATKTLGPAGTPRGIQSVNAGDFGTASSNVGQTAGSYGKDMGDVGQTASSYGKDASEHGQTAGSFGTAASNVGHNAGSYGQTAGSYGESLSTLATAAERRNNRAQWLFPLKSGPWNELVGALKSAYPGLDVVVFEVREEDLAAVLKLEAGTPDAADVLLGAPMDWRWAQAGLMKTLILPGTAQSFPPQRLGALDEVRLKRFGFGPEIALVAGARHLDKAREFALWLADGGCPNCREGAAKDNGSVALALRVVNSMVKGGSLEGDYDPAAAPVATGLYADDGFQVRYRVVARAGNDRFAAVGVRTAIQGVSEVTVLHTLVVMRRADATSAWKVLQVTPDMTAGMLTEAVNLVGGGVSGEGVEPKVAAVSVAAPEDGETLGAQPDLWWDNPGGAMTEVVEWASGKTRGTRLLLIPDSDGHVKTRVTAGFARAGVYRWRVWSIGAKGTVAMTGWRTMVVE